MFQACQQCEVRVKLYLCAMSSDPRDPDRQILPFVSRTHQLCVLVCDDTLGLAAGGVDLLGDWENLQEIN